jgi:glycosyltransferase involved in cell wall biosynthesis
VDGFILEDPHDSGRLAELIDLLRGNEALREKMSEAAAKTAQRYTWDENAAKLNQLFQEVLHRKGLNSAAMGLERSAR